MLSSAEYQTATTSNRKIQLYFCKDDSYTGNDFYSLTDVNAQLLDSVTDIYQTTEYRGHLRTNITFTMNFYFKGKVLKSLM